MSTQAVEPRMELEQNLHMFRQMAKIRAFDEQVNELYKSAKMPGLAHLYVGQEGVAVGVDIRLTVSVTNGDGVGAWLGADSVTMLQPTTHTLINT